MIVRYAAIGFSILLATSLAGCAAPTSEEDATRELESNDEASQLGVISSPIITGCSLERPWTAKIKLVNLDIWSSTTFAVSDQTGMRRITVPRNRTQEVSVSGDSFSVNVRIDRGLKDPTSCATLTFGGGRYYGR